MVLQIRATLVVLYNIVIMCMFYIFIKHILQFVYKVLLQLIDNALSNSAKL